jgi:hypothetical protein
MARSKLQWLPLCLALTALALAPAACNDDSNGGNNDEVGDGDGDGDGGDGTTPCGTFGTEEVTCQAGQYCADSVLSICENGCLNNNNCAGDQVCEKDSGENVGTCQNTTDPTTTGGDVPSEAEFCEKLLSCDAMNEIDMEICSAIYAGTSSACQICIMDNTCGDFNTGACDEPCDFGE